MASEECEVTVFFKELQHATDSFRFEQQKQLEHFHAEMECLLVRQQHAFEKHTKSNVSVNNPQKDNRRSSTTYVFDSTVPMLEDYGNTDSDTGEPTANGRHPALTRSLDTPKSARRLSTKADIASLQEDARDEAPDYFKLMQCAWRDFVTNLRKRRRLRFDRLQYVVQHKLFVMIGSLVISTNVVYIGFVIHSNVARTIAQFQEHDGKLMSEVRTPDWETYMDLIYTTVFTVEIIMRILGEEFEFFFGRDWNWNCMDLMLVLTSVAEIVISRLKSEVDLNFIRLLRLLRVTRTLRSVRILRVLRLFSKFRMLLHAIQNCLSPLVWACVLLFWMLYIFSLFFLNGVSEYFMSNDTDADVAETLQTYFGALDGCLLTLFMCISGGLSWEVAVNALMMIHVAYGLLFVLFIASMMLAALNIFAGIFVNDAIELCQQDRDTMLQAQHKKNQAMEKDLMELFAEFDADKSGSLTCDEFTDAFKKEEVQARFRHLGVDFKDTQSLFEMLDISENDELDIKEFSSVCLRAKELTRPVDLQSFIQQNRRVIEQVRRGLTDLEGHIGKIGVKVDSFVKLKARVSPDDDAQQGSRRETRVTVPVPVDALAKPPPAPVKLPPTPVKSASVPGKPPPAREKRPSTPETMLPMLEKPSPSREVREKRSPTPVKSRRSSCSARSSTRSLSDVVAEPQKLLRVSAEPSSRDWLM